MPEKMGGYDRNGWVVFTGISSRSTHEIAEDGTVFKKPRFAFEGDIITDSPYLNRDVSDYPFGSGGAVTYIPRDYKDW